MLSTVKSHNNRFFQLLFNSTTQGIKSDVVHHATQHQKHNVILKKKI